ncbi:hypothetical protein FCR2A7T_15890 [Flavobacterium cauense R2A-7]|nr:hypothetical protein FCR2A7T_15890 [Flavobacterium cauense R2A-7]
MQWHEVEQKAGKWLADKSLTIRSNLFSFLHCEDKKITRNITASG